MKKYFNRAIVATLGLSLLMPAFTMAQTTPGNTGVRANVNTGLMATSTRAEVRANAAAGTSANADARITRAKERAQEEIDRRIKALNALTERISAMKRVSEGFKGDLRATVNAEIANIEALRARIEANTSTSTLKTDIQSIARSYRVFALVLPKAQIAAAADRIVTMTATMSEIGAKLNTRIEAAAAAGSDTAALTEELRSLAENIDSANTHAQAAVDGTATLKPDEGDKAIMEANTAALKAAREELRLAHQDVQEGRKNIQTIIDGLKKLDLNTNATSTTQN